MFYTFLSIKSFVKSLTVNILYSIFPVPNLFIATEDQIILTSSERKTGATIRNRIIEYRKKTISIFLNLHQNQ